VTLEYHHRFARLHKKRFILFKILEGLKDRVERFPIARGFSSPAIDDKIIRFLCHFRVKIILDHAIGGFAEPVLTGEINAPGGADSSRSRHDEAPYPNKKSLTIIIRREGWVFENCVTLLQKFDRVDNVIEDGEKFLCKLLWGCQLNHDHFIVRLKNDGLGACVHIDPA